MCIPLGISLASAVQVFGFECFSEWANRSHPVNFYSLVLWMVQTKRLASQDENVEIWRVSVECANTTLS